MQAIVHEILDETVLTIRESGAAKLAVITSPAGVSFRSAGIPDPALAAAIRSIADWFAARDDRAAALEEIATIARTAPSIVGFAEAL